MKIEGNRLVGVDPGGGRDVDRGLPGDLLDPRNISSQANHREVDNRAHSAGVELVKSRHGVRNPWRLPTPLLGIILQDFRIQHEDVLVHQRRYKLGGAYVTTTRLYRAHCHRKGTSRPGRKRIFNSLLTYASAFTRLQISSPYICSAPAWRSALDALRRGRRRCAMSVWKRTSPPAGNPPTRPLLHASGSPDR